MKVDNRFGSIWDELPSKNSERKVPENIDEAMELFHAAKESNLTSTMKAWDSHNDMVEKSAKLRKIKEKKEFIEQRDKQHREEQRELMAKIAIENAQKEAKLEAIAIERKEKEKEEK